ncbi:SAM-dependent methyltransferase [Umezawaea endophytica]|uniref:SAM-dependent methyltransferase n=1 Tax=Umezawaea endophytica TaxID=1654476 RepID=A0A9X2VGX1_9PSEU|nr:SAM-dependent methyltransferase [Umezawaea endophytica]MCS7476425.1 SAM-dependent methyltransferase [Umezawaea endophytica]
MELANWVPAGSDTGLPSAARLYDYLLGGGHNFAADRALAEELLVVEPNARAIARHNRSFLRRAVLYMIDQGVQQFLDLGSGIPTVGNVHEVARRAAPETRVVYVDFEDIAVAHSRRILAADPLAAIVQEDLTEPTAVLDAASRTGLLDLAEPVGLLAVSVLHFVSSTADAAGALGVYRDAVASGSHLALSHATADLQPVEMAGIVEVMKRSANPVFPRSHAEVHGFFLGFDVVDPGVVPVPRWRPERAADDDPASAGLFAGVGHKG